jgi:hypothetical protein
MSYRKLKIKDVEYEYVIGRTHTKVKLNGKSMAIYTNASIGNPIGHPYASVLNPTNYLVTPLNVKNAILNKNIPEFNTPEGKTIWMMVNPFDAEIYDKITYMALSKENHDSLAGDI